MADEVEHTTDPFLARERQQHDVLAALEVGRMRAGARVDDRMPVDRLHPRVVPAPPQVVALLVVGGGAEPGRAQLAVVERLAHDEALLEVRLVVVGALERGAPVVHRVEEHVVEDDPRAFADDAAVIDDPRVLLADPVVLVGGGGGRAARHPATQQQRGDQPGVHEARRQADPCEPARRREPLVLGARLPAPKLERVERMRDEPEELGLARGPGPRPRPAARGRARRPGWRCAPHAASDRSAGRTPRRRARSPSGRTARRR